MGKKLFVSCPMRGRTEENIKKSIDKLYNVAKILFDEPDLELIDSYEPNIESYHANKSIYALGKSIEKLAGADYFIGVSDYSSRGCTTENYVSTEYGIETITISPKYLKYFAPDATYREEQEELYDESSCCDYQLSFELPTENY